MATINYNNIVLELLNGLRSSDVLSLTERGVSTQTDSFIAEGGSETFTLTKTNCKNVRSVTVESVALTFGKDYTLTYNALGNISEVVVTKTLTETDQVVIIYDYGTGDKIYPDLPKLEIAITSFPRMGFRFISMDTEQIAVGGVRAFSPRIQIRIVDYKVETLLTKMNTLRSWLKTNEQGLYYSNILRTVGGSGWDLLREEGKNKLYGMDLDIINELNIER